VAEILARLTKGCLHNRLFSLSIKELVEVNHLLTCWDPCLIFSLLGIAWEEGISVGTRVKLVLILHEKLV
jgi:hypothetical protein